MIPYIESVFIGTCLEGYFYGKISVLCALTCTLAEEVQPLGLYSGIFVMYLQCPSKKSRTATILFYSLWLLYVLSTVTFAADLVTCISEVSCNSNICENIIFYQLCSCVSVLVHYRLKFRNTQSPCCFSFLYSELQQVGVVTSSRNVS